MNFELSVAGATNRDVRFGGLIRTGAEADVYALVRSLRVERQTDIRSLAFQLSNPEVRGGLFSLDRKNGRAIRNRLLEDWKRLHTNMFSKDMVLVS